jgi:hypothetical protein
MRDLFMSAVFEAKRQQAKRILQRILFSKSDQLKKPAERKMRETLKERNTNPR